LGIASHIHIIHENGAPVLRSFESNRRITGLEAQTSKALCLEAIGLRSYQSTFGSATPKVDAARLKELSRRTTERLNELTGIVILRRGTGEFQEELLESLIRMRRRTVGQSRTSGVTGQLAPSAS
jgi:hypothetical protein